MRPEVLGGHLTLRPQPRLRPALRFFSWAFELRKDTVTAPDRAWWLMKSEPEEASILDLERAPRQTLPWTGVRNYQARNFMRDDMRPGDRVLFYHSSCAEPGVAGIAEVSAEAYPDATQFDPASPYYDPKSERDKPRWLHVDVRHVATTPLLSLKAMRARPALAGMRLLRPGNRLSITPVTQEEARDVLAALAELGADRSLLKLA
jgi:predicted RNA-binding protein with PUA-like domain